MVIADRIAGLNAAHTVLAALFMREKTGKGQRIEIPMFETLAALVMADHMGGETFIPAAGPVGYQRLLTRHVHPSEGRIRGTRVPARWSEADLSMRLHAPRLGEHSIEVLLEAGLSQRQIDELVAAGVTLASPDAQEREARQ